MFLLVNVTGV